MGRSKKLSVDRRNFLRNAAIAGAATLAAPAETVFAHPTTGAPSMPQSSETATTPNLEVLTTGRPGSDFMIDVIKTLDMEYCCANPGMFIEGLHESVVNYSGNRNPEFITCTHEDSAVAMSHAYAKVEGKPLLVLIEGTVGLQHAVMAINNAFYDRVPVYMIIGDVRDAEAATFGMVGIADPVSMVRNLVKWDDSPVSLQGFANSAVRAYQLAMTPPMMPVVLVADSMLQESTISDGSKLSIPKLTIPPPPKGDSGEVMEAARLLAQAENPVIVVDRAARTQAGVDSLVELAELLQAPVVDRLGRMNFPSQHPLNQSQRGGALIAGADVILGLELMEFCGSPKMYGSPLHRTRGPHLKANVKLISISSSELCFKINPKESMRFVPVDLPIAADGEATLPSLIEEVRRQIPANRRSALQDRGAKLAAARQEVLETDRTDATYGWDTSPISTARMCAEVWAQIKHEDWALGSANVSFMSGWPQRLWTIDKHYQYNGHHAGGGEGYYAPASVGAALAHRKHGRLSVSIQCDGDFLYGPSVLWTAAHHRIPMLIVMHNNRAYHAIIMLEERMACLRNRGVGNAKIGTSLGDPNIDYAKLAQGLGLYAEGPITDPNDLGAALKRAIAVVKRGEPALVDVVTQGR